MPTTYGILIANGGGPPHVTFVDDDHPLPVAIEGDGSVRDAGPGMAIVRESGSSADLTTAVELLPTPPAGYSWELVDLVFSTDTAGVLEYGEVGGQRKTRYLAAETTDHVILRGQDGLKNPLVVTGAGVGWTIEFDTAGNVSWEVNAVLVPLLAITSDDEDDMNAEQAGQTFSVTTGRLTGSAIPALTLEGTLPTGMTFTDNGDGTATIAGTPAAGTDSGGPDNDGVYPLKIQAAQSDRKARQNFTLTINSGI